MASATGLEGVVAAETVLSLVDGQRGILIYRGYYAKELAGTRSFEEVAHLLWYGSLPGSEQLSALQAKLRRHRTLPPHVKDVIDALPTDHDMMSVLRTAISSMAITEAWPPSVDQAIRLTAVMPTMVAYRLARLSGQTPVEPHAALPHTANYLYMLTGQIPREEHVRALEAYLVITMEHGMNASTFAARVVTSTQSDMTSAVTAALGAMKGPLHGGAPSEVMDMLDGIGSSHAAERWLREALEAGQKLMGFGHRVYKTTDPRAEALRDVVGQLAATDEWFHFAVDVEATALRLLAEYKPGRKLYTNVEYWASAVFRAINIPKAVYTPTFSISRVVGWTANTLEQAEHNRIIRPQSVYVGPMPE